MINPDYDISVYNNIFHYLSLIILILPQITGFPTSRWEDKVTATKIRGSLDTHEDPPERISSVWINKANVRCFLCVLLGKIMIYLFTIIFSVIHCGTF